MFKKVISTPGFWKSVFSITIAFAILFVIVKWAIEGFKVTFFSSMQSPYLIVLGLLGGGFVYGFLVTYGKVKAQLKKEERQ